MSMLDVQISWMRFRSVGSCEMVTMRHLIGATMGGRERTWNVSIL